MRNEPLRQKFKLKEGQYTLIEHEQEMLTQDKYQILFDNAVETIMVIENQEIKVANPMAQELTGYSAKELLSMSFLDLISPEDCIGVIVFHKKRLMGEKEHAKQEFRIVRKDGEIRWVEFDGIKILWNNHIATLNFIIDITDRKEAENALKQSEEKYRQLTEYASDVIWIFNSDKKKFTYVSPGIQKQRGLTVEEAMAESLKEALTAESYIKVNEEFQKNLNEFTANMENPENYMIEIQQPCKDGSTRWIEISTKFRSNPDGDIEIVGVSRDIDKRKKAEEEAVNLSCFDELTGLYNRDFYEQELIRLNTQNNLPITLIMARIKGLKVTNDTFGFKMGDQLIQTTAKILKKASRSEDIVIRIGGDEFVVLLPNTNATVAELVVKRMVEAIKKTEMNEIILSVSFGWATKNQSEEDVEKIYTEAEEMIRQGTT